MSTFIWFVRKGAALDVTPKVRTAVFGDGYQQRVGDGINRQARVWQIESVDYADEDIDAIEAFLVARDGAESFDWTPPTGAAGKFICKSWRRTANDGRWQTISATFEEVFGE